ncbi:type II pantothenate kinase [Niameybacter massiliensis]|uniref:type II pantothenate kinase n=1 Tax=Niameybacter massiliensis TaxID=1658108 RepID=UPI0006B438F1|nr:type II pantothenate kinase [Niameybacter massiliensis]
MTQIILGVDVGGTTTKIVGYRQDKTLIGTLQVCATDQMTSLYGAIGNFLKTYQCSLKEVVKIVLTGVGASFIEDNIYDIPTYKVKEFEAIGLGGTKLVKLEEALVVSMGTGTAFVRVQNGKVNHIGGSGVGGGTLMGLASLLIDKRDSHVVATMGEKGNLGKVDLVIQDITHELIPSLPQDATASNFGLVKSDVQEEDIALGLMNMIFQTVGMMAVFACQNTPIKHIIITGSLATLSSAQSILDGIGQIHGIQFIIPEHAVFATAIGAVTPYL